MFASYRAHPRFVRQSVLPAATLGISFLSVPVVLMAQSVPPALESPAARPPQVGPHGEKLLGMPKFHAPEPYDIDEHTGYKEIFDGDVRSTGRTRPVCRANAGWAQPSQTLRRGMHAWLTATRSGC
jgi:hypothetical protein